MNAICYSGTTCLSTDKYERVVELKEALDDYDRECEICDGKKREAREKGLTKVIMSGEHIVSLVL